MPRSPRLPHRLACARALAMTCASRVLSWTGLPLSHLVSATSSLMFKRSFIVASKGCRASGAGGVVPAWAPPANKPSRVQASQCERRGERGMDGISLDAKSFRLVYHKCGQGTTGCE